MESPIECTEIDKCNLDLYTHMHCLICSISIDLNSLHCIKCVNCTDGDSTDSYSTDIIEQTSIFDTLSIEQIYEILKLCDISTIGRFGQTCRFSQTIIKSSFFWDMRLSCLTNIDGLHKNKNLLTLKYDDSDHAHWDYIVSRILSNIDDVVHFCDIIGDECYCAILHTHAKICSKYRTDVHHDGYRFNIYNDDLVNDNWSQRSVFIIEIREDTDECTVFADDKIGSFLQKIRSNKDRYKCTVDEDSDVNDMWEHLDVVFYSIELKR